MGLLDKPKRTLFFFFFMSLTYDVKIFSKAPPFITNEILLFHPCSILCGEKSFLFFILRGFVEFDTSIMVTCHSETEPITGTTLNFVLGGNMLNNYMFSCFIICMQKYHKEGIR